MAVSDAASEDLLRELQQKLCSLLNGDIRHRRIVHYCQGCCAHAREAAMKLADVLVTAFVSSLGTAQPSTSRWHTFEESMVPQTALMLLHQIGSRSHHTEIPLTPLGFSHRPSFNCGLGARCTLQHARLATSPHSQLPRNHMRSACTHTHTHTRPHTHPPTRALMCCSALASLQSRRKYLACRRARRKSNWLVYGLAVNLVDWFTGSP